MLKRLVLLCPILATLWMTPVSMASTLGEVRARAELRCGVVGDPEDWNKSDLHGPLTPLYTEICKAVSVAALGAKASVDLKPYLTEMDAEEGVAKGEVDVVVGVSPDASSMARLGIQFGPPVFYDGQGLLVRGDAHATSMSSLSGKRICAIEGTDNEHVLAAQAKARGIALTVREWQEESEMDDALSVRRCDGVSAYLSRLANLRNRYAQLALDTLLPDILTLSPAAPAYRGDDRQWGMIVDWTIHALVQAEASGITMANVHSRTLDDDPVVQRLLGTDWSAARALGLDDHGWAEQVISVVGNYGEIYDRTVGTQGSLRLPRGLNALWTNGGLIHPLPVR
jgi:general L-amino acid transport system substrate-binding protein